jgi:hypothetical protein
MNRSGLAQSPPPSPTRSARRSLALGVEGRMDIPSGTRSTPFTTPQIPAKTPPSDSALPMLRPFST